MLETSAKHKALPPLGRALDMRDSHPAAEVGDRIALLGVSTPRSAAFTQSTAVIAKLAVDRKAPGATGSGESV